MLNPSVTGFLTSRASANAGTKPKAYLNIVLFDEQFKPVFTYDGKNSAFQQVSTENILETLSFTGRQLTKNGYLYIYVSNETPNIDVFFDNLQVTHTRGPLLEETHYYPFGLTMAGISSKAAGKLVDRRKFNGGNELQREEFSDGSGLEIYDARYRMFDPQLGRFLQIDPLDGVTLELTLYAFANNNPINLNDPFGLSATTPGVNSNDPEKDAARMQDVVVTGHKKGSSKRVEKKEANKSHVYKFAVTWTRQDRKDWDDAEALFAQRKASSQAMLQGTKNENEFYRKNQERLQMLYQADEDYKRMSIGAVVAIASPVIIMAAPEVIAATQPYAGKFGLNWFKQFAANNGDVSKIDYFDVTFSTISPFGGGISGKLGTDIINSAIDFKDNELRVVGLKKSLASALFDGIYNGLRTGVKTTLRTGDTQNLLIDIHGGQLKNILKDELHIK